MKRWNDGELTRWFRERGLLVVESRESMESLASRHGVTRERGEDRVYVGVAPLFAGMQERWYFVMQKQALLAPVELHVEYARDASGGRNHAVALRELEQIFGAAREGGTSNTREAYWAFERMTLSLRTYVRDVLDFKTWFGGEAGVYRACRVTLDRNWVEEGESRAGGAWIEVAEDVLWRPGRGMTLLERGLYRRVGEAGRARVWCGEGELGWTVGEWEASVARDRVLKIRHWRVYPGRGSGYTDVELWMRDPFSRLGEEVSQLVMRGKDPEELDEVVQEMGRLWGVEVEVRDTNDV